MSEMAMKVGNGFIVAFEKLGVSPDMAERGAERYVSVDSWRKSQIAQTVSVGAGSMLIPGHHHLMVMTADFSVIMHKMAIMTWGIGHKMGVTVDARTDLANVLALWSHAISESDLHEVLALGSAAILTGAGMVALGVHHMGATGFANAVAVQIVSKSAGATAGALVSKVGGKGAGKAVSKVTGKLAAQAMQTIAPNLGAKVAAQMGAKHVGGWIPIVGAVVGGGINYWIMSSMADAAQTYYRYKARA